MSRGRRLVCRCWALAVSLMLSMPDADAAALFRAQVLALTELDDDAFAEVEPWNLPPILAYFPRRGLSPSPQSRNTV